MRTVRAPAAVSVALVSVVSASSGVAWAKGPSVKQLEAKIAREQKQLAADEATLTKLEGKTAKPKAAAAPTVVYSQSGSGNLSTPSFHVANEWQLAYTYNCASQLGGQGNFIVQISQPLGKVGLDVTANDQGPNEVGA